ncbi:methyltransferase [Paralcaligenes ureilyticus]|uniref:Methylase of polypeptide subunit release factors n=1 Tax=Paralcaligenes ureilyticus TaxID=627131 RepID=A0A4R3M5N3_9BURK|nr:class I SAM-dependent methyltransferase [Paralcaligenes ureilyticus]TCT08674.1 methylase of polypeptide subunit release factors [Paralcaligenes ureilyticus]
MPDSIRPAAPTHAVWEENEQPRRALWCAENHGTPPKRVVPVDDALTADTAFRLANAGTAMLWRGDFQNARQLLQALTRRVDKRRKPKKDVLPSEAFGLHRLAQSQRARLLNSLLIELDGDFHIGLRRAPDVRAACEAALGQMHEPLLLSLRALQGIIGSYEWRKKGIAVAGLSQNIHVHYGVFSPIRGEYIELVAQTPLPATDLAFDIGTGSGVLAAVLAQRGIKRIIATENDPRALACARENVQRLGLESQIEIQDIDLFPAGQSPLIVCNPPWLPARPTLPLEHAIYDPDSRMLLGFLNGLAAHLCDGGEGWLIMSDLAEHLGLRSREFLLDAAERAGLRILARHDARPLHPKALDETDALHLARKAEVTSLWRLGHSEQ